MMQFLPSSTGPTRRGSTQSPARTWGSGDLGRGVGDLRRRLLSADSGAPGNIRHALFSYNNADWYVDLILAWAANYAGGDGRRPAPLRSRRGSGPPPVLGRAAEPAPADIIRATLDILSPDPALRALDRWARPGTRAATARSTATASTATRYGAYYTVDFNKGTWPQSEEDDGEPILAAADGIINNVYPPLGGGWVVEMYHRSPDGTQLRTLYVHLKWTRASTRGSRSTNRCRTARRSASSATPATRPARTSTSALRSGRTRLGLDPPRADGRAAPPERAVARQPQRSGQQGDVRQRLERDRPAGLHQRAPVLALGAAALHRPLLESQAGNKVRIVQYWDKGRMERTDDGKGGFLISVGTLAWELLTGKINLDGEQDGRCRPGAAPAGRPDPRHRAEPARPGGQADTAG